ncbi:hypothetical protein Tco_0797633 [Tanacetum coccineum]
MYSDLRVLQVTTDEKGVETEVPPKTAQALLQRKRERKAKSILHLAIPDEYQLRFHGIKDAKSLWAAIKTRFEGLDKAYDRFQKLTSLLEVHALIMRNKDGIDDLDIDDLCLKKSVDARQSEKKNVSTQQYIVFPLWSSISSSYKSSDETYKNDTADDAAGETPVQKPASENEQALKNVLDKMMDQEKEASEQSVEYTQVLFGLKLEWITTGNGYMWQSQVLRYHGGAPAQTRSERVLENPNEPPLSEGHTSGSGEGRMEHQFELTGNVPITTYDSPLLGGYTVTS